MKHHNNWTIARRLAVCSALMMGLMLALFGAARWSIHEVEGWNNSVTTMADAQLQQQEIVSALDAMHRVVVDGVLAAGTDRITNVDARSAALLDKWQTTSMRLNGLLSMDIPAQLREPIRRLEADMTDYVALGHATLNDDALSEGRSPQLNDFQQRGDELRERLDGLHDQFGVESAQLRARAAQERGDLLRLIASVAMLVTACGISLSYGLYGSIRKSVQRDRLVTDRVAFGQELVSALEMADSERDVHETSRRAMAQTVGHGRVELLLTDATRAHLIPVVVHSEGAESPGCGVESPFGCAAVRRGATTAFRSSGALDACPKLVGRSNEALTAVCAPVSFMGNPLGVLHAVRDADDPFSADEIDRLGTLATGVGTRLGTVQAFETTQLQASTDSLTGLPNRRALEARIAQLTREQRPFSMVLIDLDHFKILNDSYGHDMGDRWLRQFSDVATSMLRSDDLVARWGGEEFVLVLPSTAGREALSVCDRFRAELQLVAGIANLPKMTASFGIVTSSTAPTFEELFAHADTALYQAKRRGRDQAVLGPVDAAEDDRFGEVAMNQLTGKAAGPQSPVVEPDKAELAIVVEPADIFRLS